MDRGGVTDTGNNKKQRGAVNKAGGEIMSHWMGTDNDLYADLISSEVVHIVGDVIVHCLTQLHLQVRLYQLHRLQQRSQRLSARWADQYDN